LAASSGTLYYGDNLDVLRRYVKDESVDVVYLDPPFKSDQQYNVLFKERSGQVGDAHRDHKEACSSFDAVPQKIHGRTGFDQAAHEFLDAFPVRYYGYRKKPHRQRFRQCDGDRVGWNGRQLFFAKDK
jgi:hypothetical protein